MTGTSYDDADLLHVCRKSIDYEGIVKHINDGVVILREGAIIFANDAMSEIAGRRPDELMGLPLTELAIDADRERVLRHCTDKLYTPELSDRIEFSIRRDQTELILEMKLTVIDCAGTPGILAAITDITERRRTRLELQSIKDRLESILHSMNDVVVSLSAENQRILSINPAVEALLGVPRRDFNKGRATLLQFVHPDDRQRVAAFYASLADEEFGDMQYRFIAANGRVRWVHDEGHYVFCLAGSTQRVDHVIRDITAQKEALDALTRSEERYRDFFQSTKDMAYSVTPDGAFIDINEAGAQLLGFASREEALTGNLKTFYEDPSERADLLARINEDGFVMDRHVRFRLPGGRSVELAVTARAKTDDAGYLLYYEGIAHNITQALEDQRNRVLRNAAGGMCHYLNTHLMHIASAMEGLEEEMDGLESTLARPHLDTTTRSACLGSAGAMREYVRGLRQASGRITNVTRAFNSAFMTYREEQYLDRAILDIFNSCLGEGTDCLSPEPGSETGPA